MTCNSRVGKGRDGNRLWLCRMAPWIPPELISYSPSPLASLLIHKHRAHSCRRAFALACSLLIYA